MDEKRRSALLGAAKRLIEAGETDADITASLAELGVTEDEAALLMREVRGGAGAETKPEIRISPREMAVSRESSAWKESIEQRIKEEKGRLLSEEAAESGRNGEKMPEDEFPKHFISKGEGDEFMPQLKTGGKEKIKEIVGESQIGKPGAGAAGKKARELEAPEGTPEAEKIIIRGISRIEDRLDEIEEEVRGAGKHAARTATPAKKTPMKKLAAKKVPNARVKPNAKAVRAAKPRLRQVLKSAKPAVQGQKAKLHKAPRKPKAASVKKAGVAAQKPAVKKAVGPTAGKGAKPHGKSDALGAGPPIMPAGKKTG